jgi:hypothetical protein
MRARVATAVAIVLFAAGAVLAADGSWTGYISDDHCAAKGAKEGHADCAAKCVKEGAKYVLVNDTDKKVYALDAQEKVAAHAGHHVTIKGSAEGDSIKVSDISMAPAAK